jgi:hypothetical protein
MSKGNQNWTIKRSWQPDEEKQNKNTPLDQFKTQSD